MNANQSSDKVPVMWSHMFRPLLVGTIVGILSYLLFVGFFFFAGEHYQYFAGVVWFPFIAFRSVIWRWSGCPASPTATVIGAFGAAGFIGTLFGAGGAFALFGYLIS
jgi:hypothetical protein